MTECDSKHHVAAFKEHHILVRSMIARSLSFLDHSIAYMTVNVKITLIATRTAAWRAVRGSSGLATGKEAFAMNSRSF